MCIDNTHAYARGQLVLRALLRDLPTIFMDPVLPMCAFGTLTKNLKKGLYYTQLFRGRVWIEQAAGKLKRFKRVALRREKTARNFSIFVALTTAFILTGKH